MKITEIVMNCQTRLSKKSTIFSIHQLKKQKRSALVSIEIQSDNLSRATTTVSSRCGLSVRKQLLVQSSIICTSGGSVDHFPLSVASVWRHRNSARKEVAKQIMTDWLNNGKPAFPILHWDSKLIDFLSGEKEERVPLLISGASSGY